jgi:hypothetical protein
MEVKRYTGSPHTDTATSCIYKSFFSYKLKTEKNELIWMDFLLLVVMIKHYRMRLW